MMALSSSSSSDAHHSSSPHHDHVPLPADETHGGNIVSDSPPRLLLLLPLSNSMHSSTAATSKIVQTEPKVSKKPKLDDDKYSASISGNIASHHHNLDDHDMKWCQGDGCEAYLPTSKPYYRRHKVCEEHAKASTVIVERMEKRFCQQCSKFHELKEFDDKKQSCREKLASHNARRRKSARVPQMQQLMIPSHQPPVYQAVVHNSQFQQQLSPSYNHHHTAVPDRAMQTNPMIFGPYSQPPPPPPPCYNHEEENFYNPHAAASQSPPLFFSNSQPLSYSITTDVSPGRVEFPYNLNHHHQLQQQQQHQEHHIPTCYFPQQPTIATAHSGYSYQPFTLSSKLEGRALSHSVASSPCRPPILPNVLDRAVVTVGHAAAPKNFYCTAVVATTTNTTPYHFGQH